MVNFLEVCGNKILAVFPWLVPGNRGEASLLETRPTWPFGSQVTATSLSHVGRDKKGQGSELGCRGDQIRRRFCASRRDERTLGNAVLTWVAACPARADLPVARGSPKINRPGAPPSIAGRRDGNLRAFLADFPRFLPTLPTLATGSAHHGETQLFLRPCVDPLCYNQKIAVFSTHRAGPLLLLRFNNPENCWNELEDSRSWCCNVTIYVPHAERQQTASSF